MHKEDRIMLLQLCQQMQFLLEKVVRLEQRLMTPQEIEENAQDHEDLVVNARTLAQNMREALEEYRKGEQA